MIRFPMTAFNDDRSMVALFSSICAAFLLGGCTTSPTLDGRDANVTTSVNAANIQPAGRNVVNAVSEANPPSNRVGGVADERSRTVGEQGKADASNRQVFLGNGQLVNPPQLKPSVGAGDIRFNFENTDIREVIRSILGDTLQENYLVDPAVNGAVTLRTNKGINRNDLFAVLEVMLRQVNAVIVRDGSLVRIQPSALGMRGVGRLQLGARQPNSGYGITLIPLKYIGVAEMMRLLDAVVKEPLGQGGAGGSVRPEPLRNMLMVAGTPQETQYVIDTIEMFDVDWMSGMSAGLFTLEHSEAKKVLEEVDKVLGGLGSGAVAGAPQVGGAGNNLGPLYGLVRVQLIERLNAILVLSPRPEMIAQAETWIRRLDRGGSADASRLYVYPLQFNSAEKLAPILQQAMQGRASSTTTVPSAQVAPGQNPLTISTPTATGTQPTPNQNAQPIPPRVAAAQPPVGAASQGSALARNATIIADKDRNALLIVASPAEYSAIEAALKKLDVMPKQVMVEVTVVEVDLTDDFAFGVEWAASRRSSNATSPFDRWADSKGDLASSGLRLALKNRDISGNILNLLDATLTANDGKKRARIHASPKLMAVDNTPVTFNVGRSVSVQTSAVTNLASGTTSNAVTNNYQYLQTGISVSITPRISAGGLVNLEITQEVSEPTAGAAGNPNPDISKTALKNTILAQDGETIVMAGLIREKITDGAGGLPGVSRLPIVGGLFGKQSYNVEKQELLVLVRPMVVSSFEELRNASDEIRSKMLQLRDAFAELPLIGANSSPRASTSRSLEQLSDAEVERRSLRISPDLSRDKTSKPN